MSPWIFVLALIVVLVVLAARSSASPAKKHCLSRRDVSQREYYDSLNRLGFQSLQEYRSSELWRETKRRYRSSDYPQRCLICGSSDFDLHHRSYARLGEEELFDLVPLCRRHHDQLHELLDPNPELCVKDTHDYLVFLMEDEEGPDTESEVTPSQAHVPAFPGADGQDAGNPSDIKQKRSQAGKRWSPEEDAALLRDFDQGIPVEQLAERLHRGVRAVEVRLFKLGRLSLDGWRETQAEQGAAADRAGMTPSRDM